MTVTIWLMAYATSSCDVSAHRKHIWCDFYTHIWRKRFDLSLRAQSEEDTAAGLMHKRPLDLQSLFVRYLTYYSVAGLVDRSSSHLLWWGSQFRPTKKTRTTHCHPLSTVHPLLRTRMLSAHRSQWSWERLATSVHQTCWQTAAIFLVFCFTGCIVYVVYTTVLLL